ncbi:hypothetical protein E4U42_000459 [Claviceps africana]|uniref:Uncharacterized protein n=1 Tax=Claviceps africana TaxID=83212 RepID=A0A8K0NN99_9HYPO|nr:hypothetical protein E4U42_000459 [Claviceps africana]
MSRLHLRLRLRLRLRAPRVLGTTETDRQDESEMRAVLVLDELYLYSLLASNHEITQVLEATRNQPALRTTISSEEPPTGMLRFVDIVLNAEGRHVVKRLNNADTHPLHVARF